jgi:hypothetical protein
VERGRREVVTQGEGGKGRGMKEVESKRKSREFNKRREKGER